MKKIIIGADKSGFSLKEALKAHLEAKGYVVNDCGTIDIDNFMPYYEVAPIVAKAVSEGSYERGILCCGTGAGMNILANKFKGVYAVPVESVYTAKMSSVINMANVLSLGGWVVAPQNAIDMVDKWLDTKFAEGFDSQREAFLKNAYAMVQETEKNNFK